MTDGRGRYAEFYRPDQPRVPAGYPAGGQWTDAGGDAQGRGGQPVYVKGAHVLKGHPDADHKKVEPLHVETSHRAQLKSSREAARVEWGRQAKWHGHKAEDLHQLAGELMAHDQASVDDRTKALQSARKIIESYHGDWRTAAIHASKGGDATKTKGIDIAAEETARQYPHLFPDGEHEHHTDRLFDMLAAGNPKAMPEEQAYRQAMDSLDGQRAASRQRQAKGDAYEGGGRSRRIEGVPFSADG